MPTPLRSAATSRRPARSVTGQLLTVSVVAQIYRKQSLAAAPNQAPTSAVISSRTASALDSSEIRAVRDCQDLLLYFCYQPLGKSQMRLHFVAALLALAGITTLVPAVGLAGQFADRNVVG